MKTLLLVFVIQILITSGLGCGNTEINVSSYQQNSDNKVIKPNDDFATKLLNAVRDDDLLFLKKLDWNSIEINKIYEDGKSLLFVAYEYERIRTIRYLRSVGAMSDIYLPYLDGTLISLVQELGDERESLKRAVSVNLIEEFEDLKSAVTKNNFKEIKRFVDYAVDLNQSFDEVETFLTFSIKNKKSMALRALLMSQDISVNMKNKNMESPLFLARISGQKNIESELIKRGAVE